MEPTPQTEQAANPWSTAVKLLAQWLEAGDRVDTLLELIPKSFGPQERARAQSLFYGAVRHFGRIDAPLRKLVERAPRPRLRAILLVAGFEILEGGDEHHLARVVHHAVEQAKTLASPAEARLVNAVVRKLGPVLMSETEPARLAPAEALAAYFSHPEWLVRRWLAQFGAPSTRALLEWNQRPAAVYARWRRRDRGPTEAESAWLAPTSWKDHYEVRPGHWPEVARLIEEGTLYLQDPSTRIAVELLQARPGESVLDACAAPGGKSVAIADAIVAQAPGGETSAAARLVSVDLPSPRIERLKENLARVKGVEVALVQADISQGPAIFKDHGLPSEYSAVLIDVPCSNTGVMRHRVDVKWRLQENDIAKHARQQLKLLGGVSRLVGPRGRLVYSTCSLDAEENERVVQAFVEKTKGRFRLAHSVLARPWEAGHDGAAAFLLERVS